MLQFFTMVKGSGLGKSLLKSNSLSLCITYWKK